MCTILAACILASLALTTPTVSLTVRPTIMLQRGDIHVQVRVPPNAQNRILAIAWDSEGGSVGETQRQIAGEDGPVLFDLWLRSQPAAHYVFFVTLYDTRGHICGRDTATITTPN